MFAGPTHQRLSHHQQRFSGHAINASHGPSLHNVFLSPMAMASAQTASVTSAGSSATPQLMASSVAQLQQLTVLIAAVCGLQKHHILVAHDLDMTMANTTVALMATVPKGIPAVEFVVNKSTTRDELSVFLLHADTNNAVVDNHRLRSAVSSSSGGAGRTHGHYRFPSSASTVDTDGNDDHPVDHQQRHGFQSNIPKVVFLHNVSQASTSILDALMDLLTHGILNVNQTARKAPLLRIVALCPSTEISVLPQHIRNAFVASTYLGSSSLQGSLVTFDTQGGSSIISRSRLGELCAQCPPTTDTTYPWRHRPHLHHHQHTITSVGGVGTASSSPCLLDNIHVAPSIDRYFRHMLGLVRGSLSPFGCQAIGIMARYDSLMEVVKALVYLFQPASTASSSSGGHHASSYSEPQQHGPGGAEYYHHHSPQQKRRLIVGPTDIQCLIPHLVAHCILMPRREWLLMAGGGGIGPTPAPPPSGPIGGGGSSVADSTLVPSGSSVFAGGAATDLAANAAVPSLPAFAMSWVSSVGLPLSVAAEWDAVASSRRLPVANCSSSSAHDDERFAATTDVLDRSATAAGGSCVPDRNTFQQTQTMSTMASTTFLFDTTRRGGQRSAVGSESPNVEENEAAAFLSYVWCRHVVATILRERSEPPPG